MRRATSPWTGEQGLALIVALLATALMMALGMALVLTTMTESRIAAGYRDGTAALYAAEAAMERALRDILIAPDLQAVTDGAVPSSFTDGPAGGSRPVPAGGTVDLTEETHVVRADSPWWQLYAYGVIGTSYTAVWVSPSSYGGGSIAMRAHGYGPGGVQRAIEVIAARTTPEVVPPAMHVLVWRELR